MKQENIQYIEEDTIDLRGLWATLMKHKALIMILTGIVSLVAILVVLLKTPIYEVVMKMRVGSYTTKDNNGIYIIKEFEEVGDLKYELEVIFDEETLKNEETAYISRVTIPKKIDNFIEVRARGTSNIEAEKSLNKVHKYINDKHLKIYNTLLKENSFKIHKLEQLIKRHREVSIKQLTLELQYLKEESLSEIERQISYLKKHEQRQLSKRIEIIQKLDINALDEKIKFIKEVSIPTLFSKINEYEFTIEELVNNIKLNKSLIKKYQVDKPVLASINLFDVRSEARQVYDLKNKVFELKKQKLELEKKSMPELERKKKKLKQQAIFDLEIKSQKLLMITIPKLEHKKTVLLTKTIPKKQTDIDRLLNQTIPNLEEQVLELKLYSDSPYLIKTKIINNYIKSEYPIKPKKKLIVSVAFISGLMLSIFLAFFLEFIQAERKEEN